MFVLHDGPGSDLSHLQAIADISEGFALFDYVRIQQTDDKDKAWIGQVVQPNQNVSIVGDRLDPTILHGLKLMQSHTGIRSVESIQVFDILILGQYDGGQLLTPRLRPLPGAVVHKLGVAETCGGIASPALDCHLDGSPNVIGELLNAEQVPLCMTEEKFNYQIVLAGGTGSGKSNGAANLVDQAIKYGKCVLVHDAKPDYGLIKQANTDHQVQPLWTQLAPMGWSRTGLLMSCVLAFMGSAIRSGWSGSWAFAPLTSTPTCWPACSSRAQMPPSKAPTKGSPRQPTRCADR